MELGKKQTLYVVKKVEFGVYLGDSPEAGAGGEQSAAPGKAGAGRGGKGTAIRVFLYKDSRDRLIATTAEPALQQGSFALLKVKEVGRIGAFFRLGTGEGFSASYREQARSFTREKDPGGSLCGQERPSLRHDEDLSLSEDESALSDRRDGGGTDLWSRDRFGVFVAVEDQYSGLIPRKEAQGEFHVGARLQLRVTGVKEDGKLDLAARRKAYLQMDAAQKTFWA